jgi:hypothetical protein
MEQSTHTPLQRMTGSVAPLPLPFAAERQQLAAIESDLRRRLTVALELVARGQNSLFFHTREFNPNSGSAATGERCRTGRT